MRPLTQHQYDEVRRYFTTKEWRYIHECVERDRHDFGSNEVSNKAFKKLINLFPSNFKWDLSDDEMNIIESYYNDGYRCDI